MEIWRDIEGYERLYQISNMGRVRSLDREIRCGYGKTRIVKGVVIKPYLNKVGKIHQYIVNLHKNGKFKSFQINRLVVQHFIKENLNRCDFIVHKNYDYTDCRADNLQILKIKQIWELYPKSKIKIVKKLHEYYGKKYTIGELSKISGFKRATIKTRLYSLKWNVYEAVEVPISLYKGENC